MALAASNYFKNFAKIRLLYLLGGRAALRNLSSNEGCATGSLKGLVIGMFEKESDTDEPKLTTLGEKFDGRVGGKLSELCREASVDGTLGKGKVFNNVDQEFRSVAVIGLGRDGVGYNELEAIDEGMENARIAAAVGAKQLQKQGCNHITVDGMEYPEQAAEGAALAVHVYQDNKQKKDRIIVPKLDLYESPDIDAWTRGLFKAEAQNLARRLTDAPSNQITPSAFAQAAVDALCPCGVNVEVRNMDWIETQALNSFLTVARSSCEPPIFLEISYCGASADERPVLLVGKGITFNSGGICLKTPEELADCRACMAGAAVVVATIRAAAALSLPMNITAAIPLCENMPSGMAYKVGDIITCRNGKSMAIHDTAKAGVVIMADTISYAHETYKPKLIVDVATLSAGVTKSLGGSAAGMFSNSHYIWKQFHKAGALTGDRLWRLPLWQYYTKKVKGYLSVDVSNRGHGTASACLAAAVLKEFVPCVDWAHIDIRGVGMLSQTNAIPYLVKGRMTGRPTRTLVQFLYQMACPEEQVKDIKNT